MNETVIVSIITITYNSISYIDQTIRSVLDQDYPHIEYIFVDGGSTDGTLDIIKKHSALDKRLRYVSEPDNGISDAMNKGIKLATGDLIAHLHSDDYYCDATVISEVVANFAEYNPYWITGGMKIVNETGAVLAEIPVRKYSYDSLVSGNTLLHPSTFIARRAFDKVGFFDLSLKHAMDYDLWLRLGKLGDPVRIDRPLSCFRAHTGSLSTFEAEQASREEWMIRKKFLGRRYLKIFYHYCRFLRSRRGNARYFARLLGTGNDRNRS